MSIAAARPNSDGKEETCHGSSIAPKPLSAGDLSDDPALSAAQRGDPERCTGLLPALHPLSADDLHQRPAGLAGSERGGDPGGAAGDFAPGDPGIYRSVPHLCGGKSQSSAAALWAVLLAVFSHAGDQCPDALRAHGVSSGAAPAGGGPPAQKPFVYGAADRGHRRDTDVDDGGQPVFGIRCGKLPPAAVCGRTVGPAPVPGGGHGGFLCPLFPLCAGPG